MILVIISVVLFAVAFVVLGFKDVDVEVERTRFNGDKYTETRTETVWKLNRKQLCALLAVLVMLPGFIARVPANSVGIKYSSFTGTSETTLSEGFKIKSPFDKVYNISTEVQTMRVENLTTQTKDAQYVTSSLDIKYRVDSKNAYLVFTQFKTLNKMSESLIIPTTQRVLELITTEYNVIDVLGEKRSEIYNILANKLSEEFAKYGVEFYSISISDMDAGEAIESAITAEAVAKKAVETAEQELLKAETEAKQKSVTARAEQEAAKIDAETKIIEAEAEKKANELLNQSLSEDILMQQWIEKWNGKVPTYYGGNGADLIFNTGDIN